MSNWNPLSCSLCPFVIVLLLVAVQNKFILISIKQSFRYLKCTTICVSAFFFSSRLNAPVFSQFVLLLSAQLHHSSLKPVQSRCNFPQVRCSELDEVQNWMKSDQWEVEPLLLTTSKLWFYSCRLKWHFFSLWIKAGCNISLLCYINCFWSNFC